MAEIYYNDFLPLDVYMYATYMHSAVYPILQSYVCPALRHTPFLYRNG